MTRSASWSVSPPGFAADNPTGGGGSHDPLPRPFLRPDRDPVRVADVSVAVGSRGSGHEAAAGRARHAPGWSGHRRAADVAAVAPRRNGWPLPLCSPPALAHWRLGGPAHPARLMPATSCPAI